MANPVWPVTLPVYVLENGYQEQLPRNTEETEMDAGPPKTRRRFTKVFRRFQVVQQMTAAQAAIFETFYLTTCASGGIPFDWVHPRTRAAMSFKFTQPPPVYQVVGSIYVRVTFVLLEV